MPKSLEDLPPLITDVELSDAGADGEATLSASFHGDINLTRSPEVRQHVLKLIDQHHPRDIRLNLSDVPYMDSSGIAGLVEFLKRARAHGGTLRLVGMSKRVRGLLEISKLESLFQIEDAPDKSDGDT